MSVSTAVAPRRTTTTVGLEVLVAVSGVLLVLFILSHLAGNLLIFAGPDALNHYSEKLLALGPLLWVARIGLLLAAIAHIAGTVTLYVSNHRARGGRYEVYAHEGRKTVASRTMIYGGIALFLFIFLHLYDFTFGTKEGAGTIVEAMGQEELGLYGLVWNTFANPIHSLIYIIAMAALGLHLSHGISSFVVTLGILSDAATGKMDLAAKLIGLVVALGFSAIPLYVLVQTYL